MTTNSKKIIAVDFDGTITLRDNRKWLLGFSFNDIMQVNFPVVKKLCQIQKDYRLILWTCRRGRSLRRAVQYCRDWGIKFEAVNRNLFPHPTSRKIYADFYLDNQALTLLQFMKL